MRRKARRITAFAIVTGLFVVGATLSAAEDSRIKWKHLTSKMGDLKVPSKSNQQTATLIADVDKDGAQDFIIACRRLPPSVILYRHTKGGWERLVVDDDLLPIEAGSATTDIDGDGDLDLVFGADASGNDVWWWENPYPKFDPKKTWTRHDIKNTGANKHHHQMFGDFDGDGREELVYWNQRGRKLFLAEIPDNPKETEPWPATVIYEYDGKEHEGLAKVDIDGDGKIDIVGGGNWYKHRGGTKYEARAIDAAQRFTRAAAGQLKKNGWGEAVFSPGDATGRLKWYEWDGNAWVGHDLLGEDIVHGHSLEVADIDGDGNLDVFCAEMHTPGHKDQATMYIFYGDGKGTFEKSVVQVGIGNHESMVADIDGDGDMDIVNKPYTWSAPRIDLWLNEGKR